MSNENIDEEEEEESGLSFGDICHRIWKAKYVWFASWLAIFLIAALTIQFGYTKPNRTYVAPVTYRFTNSSIGEYPNGDAFSKNDLISEDAKEYLKTYADADIKGVNSDLLFSKGDIKVTAQTQTNVYNGTTYSTDSKNSFVISIKADYFSSEAVAKKYFTALASYPDFLAQKKDNSEIDGYTSRLNKVTSLSTYTSMIESLNIIYKAILSKYASWSTDFGASFNIPSSSGATLTVPIQTMVSDFKSLLGDSSEGTTDFLKSFLNSILIDKGYVKDYAKVKDSLQIQLDNLNTVIANLQQQIKNYTDAYTAMTGTTNITDAASVYNTYIGPLVSQLNANQMKAKVLESQINQGQNADSSIFDGQLNDLISTIGSELSLMTIQDNYILESHQVSYDYSSVINLTGGLSLPINLGVSFIAGLLIASLIAGIVGNNLMKKEAGKKKEA
jgi:hypothetical protein